MNRANKFIVKIICTLLSLYLIILYAMNAVAEVNSAQTVDNSFWFLVVFLWIGTFMFFLQLIFIWHAMNFKLLLWVAIISVTFSVLAFFSGFNILVPLLISIICSFLFIYVNR